MEEVMNQLPFKQRACICFWGTDRIYKYFDLLANGMHQKAAYETALKWQKRKKYE